MDILEKYRDVRFTMDEMMLLDILKLNYGIDSPSLEFLREGGSHTYIVNGKIKYLLKVIGSAFSDTARQSVAIMRYLEKKGFPVPKTMLTKSGESIFETEVDGEMKLIVLMEFIDGDEPELESCAAEVGALVGRFHQLMEEYPVELVSHGKEFFIDRYLNFLSKKNYPRIAEYEELGGRLWDKVYTKIELWNRLPFSGIFKRRWQPYLTNYFTLQQKDIEETKEVYQKFLLGYSKYHKLSNEEIISFPYWVAIRHFQLQATILEIHGVDCIDEGFIDGQLYWLNKWQEVMEDFLRSRQ